MERRDKLLVLTCAVFENTYWPKKQYSAFFEAPCNVATSSPTRKARKIRINHIVFLFYSWITPWCYYRNVVGVDMIFFFASSCSAFARVLRPCAFTSHFRDVFPDRDPFPKSWRVQCEPEENFSFRALPSYVPENLSKREPGKRW